MLSVVDIANVVHEANRAYCRSIGDDSQPSWVDAPDWQKQSAIAGVKAVMDTPGMTPQLCHDNWMRQKLADGWTYGPVKNPETKEHPCLLPWVQLDWRQKIKDVMFVQLVRALSGLHQ